MMTESEVVAATNTIVKKYITNFSTNIISRKISTVSSIDTVIAVFFQDVNISDAMIKDLIDFVIQSDSRQNITFETKKDLGSLDYEVILISVEIFYI